MGFSLFKSGDDLFNEAVDLVKRNDLVGARDKFSDALDKDTGKAQLAKMYIAVIDLVRNRGSKQAYQNVIDCSQRAGASSFKFGITEVDTARLAEECQAYIHEIEAQQEIPDSEWQRKGTKMIEVAGEFAEKFGDQPLTIDEITNGNSKSTGTRESLILQAIAYETMGNGCVYDDPKQAAEYMQMAYTFRQQIGDSGEDDLRAVRNFGTSGRCWICGRPANGLGINFVAQNANVNGAFAKNETGEVRSFPDGPNGKPVQIYICMPCYTAISNRANDIALDYYNQGMQHLREVEARLQSEINAIRMMSR